MEGTRSTNLPAGLRALARAGVWVAAVSASLLAPLTAPACASTRSATPRPAADAAPADASKVGDGGLAKNTPPDPSALDGGQVLLTASGQRAATSGYPFPAQIPTDHVFADGWQVDFTHVIATLDRVTLWESPNLVPDDPSQHGKAVAEIDGPWAIDLHQNGNGWPYVDGQEPGDRAIAFGVLTRENLNGDMPFPTDGTRLAIGFSAVVATPNALDVNLDDDGRAAYGRMVAQGCVVLYVGTAVYSGDKGLCNGAPQALDAGGGGAPVGTGTEAEFGLVPKTVSFDLCFKPRSGGLHAGDVETSWINCESAEVDAGATADASDAGDDAADADSGAAITGRGFAVPSRGYATVQLTLRVDAPFGESTRPNAPARFDPFAAQVVGAQAEGGVPTVHLDDTGGVDFEAFTDKQGNPLPWRTCDPAYSSPDGGRRSGPMAYDPAPVRRCSGDASRDGLCDYEDFAKYDQSAQGRFGGSQGFCYVQRAYPSPP